jgi:hypothetical protein
MHTREYFAIEVKKALLELLKSISTYHFVILLITHKNSDCYLMKGSRDIVVGIMAHYGLNGPKFEPRWSKNVYLLHSCSYYLEFHLFFYKMRKGSHSGVRVFGGGVQLYRQG